MLRLSEFAASPTRTQRYQPKAKPSLCPFCRSSQIRKARLSNNKHNEYFCKSCQLIWNTDEDNTKTEKIVKERTKILIDDKECPFCESIMVLRNGKYGKFYGCSNFPDCKGTRPYNSN